ncbi:MAG: hypothetical protein HY656_08640 [Acidobacteria bacterium]|nr:hypothetical protein [Acidobacteriota bacterium]
MRITALVSLLLLGPVFVVAGFGFGYAVYVAWALLLAPAAVLALLYIFTLWRFPGKTLKNGLALATVTGAVGVLFGLLCFSLTLLVPILWFGVYLAGVFLLTNALLVLAAVRTYWTGRRQGGERPSLLWASVAGGACLGPIVLFALFELLVAQPYREFERLAEQSFENSRGPLGARNQLERINTAARTYAERYHNGYPPTLTAFGPPPDGGGPNCNHSDSLILLSDKAVMTSEFTFEHRGYRFEYRPGARLPRSAPGCTPGVQGYSLSARPLPYSSSSWITHRKVTGESFFTDETGVIHHTEEDRAATAADPPL